MALDHVVMTVAAYDTAAARLLKDHGLASVPGGKHLGHGTGNRIVPLGPSYLELMAVVDQEEAAASDLGRWVTGRTANGDAPAALCLRTDNIERVADRRGLEPLAMSRRRPDGTPLSWHLVGLSQMLEEGLPFYIEWDAAVEDLPGRMVAAHEVNPSGISWVEIGGDAARLASWLGPHALDIRPVSGGIGVQRLGVGTSAGEVVL